jgi:phosphate uptake regulator
VIEFILQVAAFSLILALLVYFAYDSFKAKIEIKKMISTVGQLIADKELMRDRLEEIANDKSVSNTEEFVRFLSESRDQAYQYIEMVHTSMESFTKEVEPLLRDNNQLLTAVNGLYDKVMPQSTDT